jgi:solute carrier family 25 S-adenosylmethionine transporter 26
MSEHRKTPFLAALISGGIAGTSVDVALFPLDTIKTRLQSSAGFLKSGGFSGVYRGLSAAAAGSAPGAALFFSTYETSKQLLQGSLPDPVVHMTAASCGEVAACLVRVPTEVVKQRMQAGLGGSAIRTIKTIIASEGGVSGLYRGFGITIMREIPFAFIQFPIYEYAKVWTSICSKCFNSQ